MRVRVALFCVGFVVATTAIAWPGSRGDSAWLVSRGESTALQAGEVLPELGRPDAALAVSRPPAPAIEIPGLLAVTGHPLDLGAQLQLASLRTNRPAQCFVAAFTGWEPGDVRFDPNESAGKAASINASSSLNGFLEETGTLHDGSLVLWRFYDWDAAALEAAREAHGRGEPIVLVGHSAGGASVVSLAWALAEEDIPVALAIELDTYRGGGFAVLKAPRYVHRDSREIPGNVGQALNFYQRSWWLYKGSEQHFPSGEGHLNFRMNSGHSGIVAAAARQDATLEAFRDACGTSAPLQPDRFGAVYLDHTLKLTTLLSWRDRSRSEDAYVIYRANCGADGICGAYQAVAEAPADSTSATVDVARSWVAEGNVACFAVAARGAAGQSQLTGAVAPGAEDFRCP